MCLEVTGGKPGGDESNEISTRNADQRVTNATVILSCLPLTLPRFLEPFSPLPILSSNPKRGDSGEQYTLIQLVPAPLQSSWFPSLPCHGYTYTCTGLKNKTKERR